MITNILRKIKEMSLVITSKVSVAKRVINTERNLENIFADISKTTKYIQKYVNIYVKIDRNIDNLQEEIIEALIEHRNKFYVDNEKDEVLQYMISCYILTIRGTPINNIVERVVNAINSIKFTNKYQHMILQCKKIKLNNKLKESFFTEGLYVNITKRKCKSLIKKCN